MTFHAIRNIRSALAVRSTRATAAYITRLTATATFAYVLATLLPGTSERPVLAPLTALLVLQASLYQTLRSGLKKVLSVTVGVLMAVGLAEFIGFSWWQLMLLIAAALLIGRALRLGDDLLEVPISAMLIFASAGHQAAAAGRVVDTLVGTAAGLLGGLAFASLQVQPARAAVCGLAGRLAALLDRMGADLADDPEPALVTEWLVQARSLRDEIERVDDTLREAADSAKLNPRALVGTAESVPVREMNVSLRGGLEALEHAALTVRGLARSVLDGARIDSSANPFRDAATRARLADVLTQLGAVIRTYGALVQTMPAGSESLESELAAQLEETRRLQDRLADLLAPRPCPVPVTETGHADADADRAADFIAGSQWPLRGEILTHVDRLRTGLTADSIPREASPAGLRPRPIRLRAPRLRPPEQFLAVTRSLGTRSLAARSLGTRSLGKPGGGTPPRRAARTASVPRQRRAAQPRDRGRPSSPRC
jgi:Aromatic acid exporter family member 1